MSRYVLILLLVGSILTAQAAPPTPIDKKMRQMGLVDVAAMDTTLIVNLMYATDDNFVGENMYIDGPSLAWLHPLAAKALVKASAYLRDSRPDLRIKICDASRPMSAQKRMYRTVRGTPMAPYVSNPANGGGLHNYGMAVDVTLVDCFGNELPMGTPVDFLGKEANIDREEQLVNEGKMTSEERANRELLRSAMVAGGFKPLRSEWWHFNLISRPEAKKKYKLIDF